MDAASRTTRWNVVSRASACRNCPDTGVALGRKGSYQPASILLVEKHVGALAA